MFCQIISDTGTITNTVTVTVTVIVSTFGTEKKNLTVTVIPN